MNREKIRKSHSHVSPNDYAFILCCALFFLAIFAAKTLVIIQEELKTREVLQETEIIDGKGNLVEDEDEDTQKEIKTNKHLH